MKTLILSGLFMAICWHFTAVESDSLLQSIVAPLGFLLSLAFLAGWVVYRVMPVGSYRGDSSFTDGGDGGCGD